MNTETTLTPEALADGDLVSYRASREGKPAPAPAAAPKVETAAEAPVTELGERAADDGTAEPSTGQGETPDSGDEADPEPKKKGGWQRTIEKQKRQIEELQRQVAGKAPADTPVAKPAEAPAAASRAEQSGAEAKSDTPADGPVFDKPKPRLEDFEGIDGFTEAMADWKYEKRAFDARAQDEKAAADRENQKRVSDWNTRKAAAQAAHDDYDDVIAGVASIQLTKPQQFTLLDSEHGPELAYKLAQNPEKLQQLVRLSPLAFARAIGKLESQFATEDGAGDGDDPALNPEPVSRAPRPTRPLATAKGAAAGVVDVANKSLSDYRALRESGKLR